MLDDVLHLLAVPERPGDQYSTERRRERADAQPVDQPEMHRPPPQVDHRADRLHHRTGDQVAGDGGQRRDAEEEHEHRRHQRAAAHAGQADDDADCEGGDGQGKVEAHEPTGRIRERSCSLGDISNEP